MSASTRPRRTHKKKIVAVLAGVAVAAAVSASASTLGGASAHTIGANTAATGSVLSKGVNVAWDTAYADGGYVVNHVTLTTNGGEKIPAAADVKLTITGNDQGDVAGAKNALVELTKTTDAATGTVEWVGAPATPLAIDAHDITGVAVVIDGNAVAAAAN